MCQKNKRLERAYFSLVLYLGEAPGTLPRVKKELVVTEEELPAPY